MKTSPKLGHRGEWYVAIQLVLFALLVFAPLLGNGMIGTLFAHIYHFFVVRHQAFIQINFTFIENPA